jgi:hypothetical protein
MSVGRTIPDGNSDSVVSRCCDGVGEGVGVNEGIGVGEGVGVDEGDGAFTVK